MKITALVLLIIESRDKTENKEMPCVPNRLLGADGDLSGDTVGIEKIECANPALAAGDESFYQQVW